MSEKEIYLKNLKEKFDNGLKDIHFFRGNMFSMSEEEIYAELNRMDNAPDLPDPEVLGKFSL